MTHEATSPGPNFTERGILAHDVLDHGYVALRNAAGPTRRTQEERWIDDPHDINHGLMKETAPRAFDADDTDPANSARMSFDMSDTTRLREQDLKLCEYLITHWHTTPFEMIETWWEMKLPIFVARQFVRHRTVGISEVSGRYVQLPADWYIPETVGGKPVNAKQGQSDNLDPVVQEAFRDELYRHNRYGYVLYEKFLGLGVAAEHARLFLQLNHYTKWLWKQDLHNLMHFLSLRVDSHAQVEAQKYAQAMISILRMVLPESMRLFDKYRRTMVKPKMTRERAIEIAKASAIKVHEDDTRHAPAYLSNALADPDWRPHDWVIDAIMEAAK